MTPTPDSAQLATEVRSLSEQLHRYEASPDDRVAVLDHLRAAGDLLSGGSERLRWYEQPDGPASAKTRTRELSPFSGRLNAVAPPMEISVGELDDGQPALIGRVRLNRLHEGPPHTSHGGMVAALFDEILGAGQRLSERQGGVTGRITVRYRKPTPLYEELEFRSWIHDDRVRRLVMRADCRVSGSQEASGQPRRLLTAEAEAIFVRVDFVGMEQAMRDRQAGAASTPAPPPTSTDPA